MKIFSAAIFQIFKILDLRFRYRYALGMLLIGLLSKGGIYKSAGPNFNFRF